MAKISTILSFVVTVHALMLLQCHSLDLTEKKTHLHFFFHDTLSGNNPTSVLVAQPNTTIAGIFPPFGSVFVFDDPLTEGPEITSKHVGRAQGFYISSSQEIPTLVIGADYSITSGDYNGSSFSVFSKNPISDDKRELAVVGGRGQFRMARGFAKLETFSLDKKTGDAIVEYNVTLFHY